MSDTETRFPETRMMGGSAPADSPLNREIFSHAGKIGGVQVALAVYAATADVWYSGGDAAYAAIVEREGVTDKNAEDFHRHWLRAFCNRLAQYEADLADFPPTPPPPSDPSEGLQSEDFIAPMLPERISPPPSETKLGDILDGMFELISKIHRGIKPQMDEETERWTLEPFDPRIEAARSSLESLYRAITEENERLREDAKAMADDLEMWREAEARVCPEDVGFDEYIPALEKQLSALRSLQLTPAESRLVLHALETNGYAVSITNPIVEKLQRISSKATSEEL